ncbi:MAG: hypothetical protein Q7R57_04115 [Dehalococcoidales bacterium]|nr:hypothetical protein [Dehalococcoidales bacterium]
MKRGIPSVVLIGEDFINQSKIISASKGMGLKYVAFPRTINGMAPEGVKHETEKAFESIIRHLQQA